ncbi:hypothetical protein HTZ84_22550 [Haloterrigena sp. SYSU A558-1]|uniref:Uncharacterized protein n=1 Tax=Haloterrigena gelatinilytica TaxID=2741724 RepID=A0ABX2LIQ5_9EURY|nr:hypothetical protein [Haloterrigena gelatinilytica]NUC75049.1 hypothetical protein [Haloterrigena gelatinilytica]
MSNEKTPLTESLNRGLNPMNVPDYYRQYVSEDPDNPDAGEIRDPDGWDDPDPPKREKYTPNTAGQWLLVIASGLLTVGAIWYLYPIFGPAYQNPLALGAFALLAVLLVVYMKGRQDGMRAYKQLDKWINYDGNSIEVRPGEHVGSSGPWKMFETIRNVSYGAFTNRKLQKRDLPYDATKLRTDKNDTGEDPARDALNPTTEIADCDHLGKFLFTHSNGLEYAKGMEGAHRATTQPQTLDEDAFEEWLRLVNELEHEVSRLEDDVEMLRDHNEDATNLREELQIPQLEQTMHLIQQMNARMTRPRRQRREDTTDEVPFAGNETEFDFGDTAEAEQ